jgi:hypothetical protein
MSDEFTTESVSTVVAAETSLTLKNITNANKVMTAKVKFLLIIPPPCPI